MEENAEKESNFLGGILEFFSLMLGKIRGFWGACDPETQDTVLSGASKIFEEVLKSFFKTNENSGSDHHE